MKDKISLIDSNILVYAFDSSEKSKHKKARELLKKCWKGEQKFAVSTQNLSEFFVNVTKKIEKPISKEDGAKIVNSILEFEGFLKLEPKKETISKAMIISIRNNMNYWDSLITATMIENEIFSAYTENARDFKIDEVKIINPFL
ncbi:PIN domain-containing protein [Candidatus Pacearchaeota archaeon]|nr:PIN domain-containing protein [Candidatus Pacearchaeota archaeon]